MTQKEIVAELLKNGAEQVENVKIEGVKVTDQVSEETGEMYYRVSLSTDKPIKAMRNDGNGNYIEGTINVVMELFSNLIGAIRACDDYRKIINHIQEHPKSLEVLLSGAIMDVVIVKVAKDSVYKNPFSRSESEGRLVKNDTFYHHVVNIRTTKSNISDINDVKKALMGI